MSKKAIRVLLSVSRMTAADLLARSEAVYAGLNLNPAYPNPPIAMPAFRTAIDNYSAAIAAALDGGAKAITQRNAVGETLRNMLRQLAHHVEVNCNADMTIFMSSGFQPVTKARAQTERVSESIRKIVPGPNSGQLLVVLVAILNALSYELRWASVSSGGALGAWTNQLVAGIRPPTSVVGLTPGTTYVFQARAFTRSGLTDWSDSVTRICS